LNIVDYQNRLSAFPRVKLLWGPTPIVRADNISKSTGVEVFIKRDDLSGLALGGNKTRKLEFLMGEAVANGHDIVLTAGAVHSNHALQTAAAAKKLGLDAVLVLRGKAELKGNYLMNKLLDAVIRIYDVPTSGQLSVYMERIAEELREKGRKPMIIPVGGSNPVGALGYFNAVLEVSRQCAEQNQDFDYVVCPTSSGGTQAGILLAYKLLNPNVRVLGIGVGDPKEEVVDDVISIAQRTASILGVDANIISRNDVEKSTVDGYGFGRYGAIDKEVILFIKDVAKKEGLYLDPVYTGKGFYGLIDLIKNQVIPKGSRVLFMHTGGLGGLFQYEDVIAEYS